MAIKEKKRKQKKKTAFSVDFIYVPDRANKIKK